MSHSDTNRKPNTRGKKYDELDYEDDSVRYRPPDVTSYKHSFPGSTTASASANEEEKSTNEG